MNIPSTLSKLPNINTIVKHVQINIIIIRSRDNELSTLDVLVFNDLDCVDDWSMCNDKEFF